MLNGQRIILISIVDNNNESIKNQTMRIWHHQNKVREFLKTRNCLIGRKTYDLLQLKGPNTWVITRNKKWKRSDVGTIHSLDDLHLFIDGPVYVIGGNSLQKQLQDYVDEIYLYVINNDRGSESWIEMDMTDWKPVSYISRGIWSFAHMQRVPNYDPHSLNDELFI